MTASRRPPPSATKPLLPSAGAGAAGPEQAEALQAALQAALQDADAWRRMAYQWQKLCAAAILDAARAEASQAVSEGEAYLARHGWPQDAPEGAQKAS